MRGVRDDLVLSLTRELYDNMKTRTKSDPSQIKANTVDSTLRTWTKIDGANRSVRWEASDALVTVDETNQGWIVEVYEGLLSDGSLGYIGSESALTRQGAMAPARRWVRALTRPTSV